MVSRALPDRWYDVVAKPRRVPFARSAGFVAALAVILTALNLYAPGAPTLAERLLSSSTLAIAALPLWLWLSGLDRGIPFMPFFGMVYAVYYAVPFFLLKSYSREMFGAPFSDSLMTRALVLTLAGLLAVLLGYYGPQRLAVARILPRVRFCWRSWGNVKLWAMVFSFAGLSSYLFTITISLPETFSQFVLLGGDLCSIGICMLFVLQLMRRLDKLSTVVLWGALVPLRVLLGLSTGLASNAFFSLLMLLTAYATVRRTMPWKMLVLGAAALLLVRPAMSPFRALTWKGGPMYRASRVEKMKLAYTTVAQTAGGGVPYELLFQYSVSRVAVDLMTLSEVLRDTPDHVPYWEGRSYYPLLFKPVPRFLYKNKPREETGQTFGHRYGLLDPMDDETSYNLAQLVELYINFSTAGVLLGMFLYGLLYRAVLDVFVHRDMGLGAVVTVVYISVKLLEIESAASLVLGGLLLAFVFMGLVNMVVQGSELYANPVASRS